MTASIEQARAAKAKALVTFSQEVTIVGIGITRVGEGYGLKINVREAPARSMQLPDSIDGVPVRLEIVGTIGKQPR
jgi:hypothetical protein